MKDIILEGSKLSIDIAGGICNYIANLFRILKQHEAGRGIETKLLLLGAEPTKNIFYRELNPSKNVIFILTKLAFLRMLTFGPRQPYHLFHSPYMYLPPRKKGTVNILTIQDTINLERGFSIRNKTREFLNRLAISRADYFICISNATRDRLKFHYPEISDNRILVIYHGIDEAFFAPVASTAFEKVKSSPYLLYVGVRSGYKNFDALVQFMAQSPKAAALKVLCTGGGPFTPEEKNVLQQLGLAERIVHVGYTSLEDIKFLYQNAEAFAYTSLQEGFGIPIIEAMVMGCPVICGNFSSMKEIANGHAVLVEDFSVASLEDAVERAGKLTPAQIAAAKKYADDFTWERTTLETLDLYSKLLGNTK